MFALQEDRSVAGVVSVIVHAGVVAALIAGAQRAASDTPTITVLPESVWVTPTGAPGGPGEGPIAPIVEPVDIPGPMVPTLPGIPTVPGPSFPISAPGGLTPIGLGGADSTIYDATVTDEPPVLLSAPVPAYPPLLRQAGIQGVVTVQAVIDTLGRAEPASLRVGDSPNPGFDRPALDCVRRALFRPARVRGRAVRVLVSIPLHFTLRP